MPKDNGEDGDNVVKFPGMTRVPITNEAVLTGEVPKDAKQLIIIGWDKDDRFFWASTHGDFATNGWLLSIASNLLVNHSLTPTNE